MNKLRIARRALWCAVLLLGLALTASPSRANAHWGGRSRPRPTKSRDTACRLPARPAAHGRASVIVQMSGEWTPARRAQLAALGADVYRRLPLIHAAALRLPARSLGRLAALPFVTHLSSDGPVQKCDEFTVSSSGAGYTCTSTSLDGSGVTVAVVDSGVKSAAPDLSARGPSTASRVLAAVSFCPTDAATGDACGHGTHVAGIVAGNGEASAGSQYYRTFYGIARNANLVSVKVLNSQGQGSVSTVVAGIQWVISNKSAYKIKVLNLSLGHPVGESYKTDPLCQAVEAAWKAGIVVVCAAGNAGRLSATPTAGAPNEGYGTAYGSIQSPANDPYVITVGATKQSILSGGAVDPSRIDDKIATYSSRGPSRLDFVCKPDLIAPGNRVISVDAAGSTLDDANGGANDVPYAAYQTGGSPRASETYFCLSGTSMAAPVVAGAAALLLQKYPTLTPDTIKARLMISADKWASPGGVPDISTYGAGYVDIPAALTCTATATVPALSPRMQCDSYGNLSLNTGNLLGANQRIWGTIPSLNVIWGGNITWGVNINAGSQSAAQSGVWNDHITWGSSTDAVDLSSTVLNGE